MKAANDNIETLAPKNQLRLFGYDNYFNLLIKLFEKEEMPNSILLSGLKGIGKSTFAYHIINYLLSKNEENKYLVKDFIINKDNSSYKLLNGNIHPNFFLIDNSPLEKDIKIEQVRNLTKFLSKTTYSRNFKLIMIDNVENLNLNSSNALLKAIEEPPENTFFFLIHNSGYKILETIKSRCCEFRFTLTISEKKNVFTNIIKHYKDEFEISDLVENYYFDTPGNLLKYYLTLNRANININENTLKCIFYFIDQYNYEKRPETLSFILLFIEKYYKELCLKNNKNLNTYFLNQSKILKQIDEMKKFNLNEKSVFIWIKDILQNEKK